MPRDDAENFARSLRFGGADGVGDALSVGLRNHLSHQLPDEPPPPNEPPPPENPPLPENPPPSKDPPPPEKPPEEPDHQDDSGAHTVPDLRQRSFGLFGMAVPDLRRRSFGLFGMAPTIMTKTSQKTPSAKIRISIVPQGV